MIFSGVFWFFVGAVGGLGQEGVGDEKDEDDEDDHGLGHLKSDESFHPRIAQTDDEAGDQPEDQDHCTQEPDVQDFHVCSSLITSWVKKRRSKGCIFSQVDEEAVAEPKR